LDTRVEQNVSALHEVPAQIEFWLAVLKHFDKARPELDQLAIVAALGNIFRTQLQRCWEGSRPKLAHLYFFQHWPRFAQSRLADSFDPLHKSEFDGSGVGVSAALGIDQFARTGELKFETATFVLNEQSARRPVQCNDADHTHPRVRNVLWVKTQHGRDWLDGKIRNVRSSRDNH